MAQLFVSVLFTTFIDSQMRIVSFQSFLKDKKIEKNERNGLMGGDTQRQKDVL
jgi:hypothetical protein